MIFKTIPEYPNYEVSDTGVVRHKRRQSPLATYTHKGYMQVSLSCPHLGPCERRTCYVHRLVLLAYVGPRQDKHETRHLDGNKLNNLLRNLVYGTASENQTDRVLHGTSDRGQRSVKTNKSDMYASALIDRYRNGETFVELSNSTGIPYKTIWNMVSPTGVSWRHLHGTKS